MYVVEGVLLVTMPGYKANQITQDPTVMYGIG
jgi:hypothetical protein